MQKLISKLTLFAAIACVFSVTGCGKHCLEDQCGVDDENDINPSAVVGPLLQTKWSQGSPYNDMFPYMPEHAKANSRNGRLVTDCGTTAATQIITFHQYPTRATGQSSILGPHGVDVPSVNFEDYTFDWANMRNTYTSADPGTELQRKAVAELMFIYGMARGSGEGVSFAQILINHFGYDRSIERLQRRFYTDADWEALIRKELDAGFPVYYYGNYPTDAPSSDGYHAFIVDGYDNTGRFHANWGWGGSYDGWYFINDFDPNAPVSTYAGESVVINIRPNKGGTGSDELFIASITSNKTNISQNEMLSVTVNMRSPGFFPGGQVAAALTDNNGRIVEIIGTANYSARNPGTTSTMEMPCYVPGTVRPGQYRLMVAVRPTGGEWKIMTRSAVGDGVPNFLNITVTEGRAAQGSGYGMAVANFSASKTSVVHNEQFTVSTRFRNIAEDIFPGGNYSAALVNDAGVIVAIIRLVNSSADPRNPGSQTNVINMDCAVPNTVLPGRYQLRVVVRTTGNEWRIVTDSTASDVPTSIDFEVQ